MTRQEVPGPVRFGADVGGTFTDVIAVDASGRGWTHKVPSTPPHFEQAVLDAIEFLLGKIGAGGDAVATVAHGTTVATNAVLERRGAKTALLTTRGFRDVLELRRIRAPQMYDLFWDKPAPLVERYLRIEVDERIGADGAVIAPLRDEQLAEIKTRLDREGVESVAVCYLHAYAHPRHECRTGEFLRRVAPHLSVSLSSEVLRIRKEYERTATTVVNAFVQPVMRRYLTSLRRGLDAGGIRAPLLVMQSAGGLSSDEHAAAYPVYALESGPAAGVLAASHLARLAGIPNIISLDMGGTTAKAALIENGRIAYSSEYEVGASLSASNRLVGGGGERIMAPTIDIAEVGAGGGSIAYLDRAGGLHVGPASAGALPGPACYGLGGEAPTLTDADVVLGYIRPGKLANGSITIDPEAARRVIHDLIAQPLGLDVVHAAAGIHRIANSNTMRALRSVSTERGRDPRDFTLVAFGGNGPIHAAGLADELLVPRTIVPPLPGLFSAVGLLVSGLEHHDARSCQLAGDELTPGNLQQLVDDMQRGLLRQFEAEGVAAGQVTFACDVDLRFRGQTSEIRVAAADHRFTLERLNRLREAFLAEHERLYGHRSDPGNPIEVVAVRLIGRAGEATGNAHLHATVPLAAAANSRMAWFGENPRSFETPVIARNDLQRSREGPLLIDEYDSTIVIPPSMRASLDARGNVILAAIPKR